MTCWEIASILDCNAASASSAFLRPPANAFRSGESDFSLATPFYAFEMSGQIRLEDLALDATGQLDLGREVVTSIAGVAGIPGIFPGLTIPLPAIRGTLTEPEPEADWGHFWRTLVGNLPGVRLLRRLGQKLPSF